MLNEADIADCDVFEHDPNSACPSKAANEHEHFCPINSALTLLNGRWTPHIIHALFAGQTRFNEMARVIGINPRTLRERLRELEEQGVISRRVIAVMPPSVEYTLTEKGRALTKIFEALAEWGKEWLEPPKIAG